MVREARFELAQGCPRQPLKLVRLPVPPLAQKQPKKQGFVSIEIKPPQL